MGDIIALLHAIKSRFVTLTIAFTATLLLILGFVPQQHKWILKIIMTGAWIAVILHIICGGFRWWSKKTKKSQTFHFAPIPNECYWTVSEQKNGTRGICLKIFGILKNCSQRPVKVVSVHLISPLGKNKVLHNEVMVSKSQHGVFGHDQIPKGASFYASIILFISGVPEEKTDQKIAFTIEILDDYGNAQKVQIPCRGIVQQPR